MRDIIFRGRYVDNGQLVEGYYTVVDNEFVGLKHYIINLEDDRAYQVSCNTIGQYTGLNDMNGKKIFEGAIVTIPNTKKQGLPGVVKWNKFNARFEVYRGGYTPIPLGYFEDDVRWLVCEQE